MRKKVRLRKKRVIGALLILIFIGYGLWFYLNSSTTYKLSKLHYSKNAIIEIKKHNITDSILTKKIYSPTLEQALLTKKFIIANLDLYYSIDYHNDDNFIDQINTLSDLGYDQMQIILIFKYLNNNEIAFLIDKDVLIDIEKYLIIDYFDINNIDRYVSYATNHQSLSKEDIVTQVNIGLDYNFYQNIKEIENPNSITVLVNKFHKLPSSFIPLDLVNLSSTYADQTYQLTKVAKTAFEKLALDMTKQNLNIKVASAYRSYSRQTTIYNDYVKRDGKSQADTFSARPGHSEHQTGLTLDVTSGNNTLATFAETQEALWIDNNAHKYGFIVRYPKDKTHITGYRYEPWHLRYVGIDIATYIHDNNITFDEYYVRFLDNKKINRD